MSQGFFCAQEFNHNLWFIQFSSNLIYVFDDKVLNKRRRPPLRGKSSHIYFIRKLNRFERKKKKDVNWKWFHFQFEKTDNFVQTENSVTLQSVIKEKIIQ